MQNLSKTKIKEIFTSIQGEGLEVGKKHIFVRFCKCNLKCNFCDTDFINGEECSTFNLYENLKDNDCDTISFTGGEPLLDYQFLFEFLKEYKQKLNKKIYLETNGTLAKELEKIIDFVDIIAMDIKLESATAQENKFEINKKFIEIAKNKNLFIKIVFDEKINDFEIKNSIKLVKNDNIPIILQPKMPLDENLNLEEVYNKFYKEYKNVYLIPQTHKFLNLA